MRGRPGCPTEQEKNSVEATGGSPPFLLLQGKVGYRVAPSSAPVCALGHLPPEGKALRCASLPVCETTSPSPPSRWAGRYGRKIQGRRPGRKKERTPCRVLKNQSRESRGEKLSPLALFPPVSREKRGPPPGRRPTGRCAPRHRKSPDHPKGTQYRPPHKRGIPRRVSPLFIPPLVGWNLSHFLPAR